jgi:hypothetical protein
MAQGKKVVFQLGAVSHQVGLHYRVERFPVVGMGYQADVTSDGAW